MVNACAEFIGWAQQTDTRLIQAIYRRVDESNRRTFHEYVITGPKPHD